MNTIKYTIKNNHEILFAKLNHFGVRGITLDWLKLYLTNRTQLTSIEGELPEETTVTYRVPQGSLLGSLLFLIYIIYISMILMKQSNTS